MWATCENDQAGSRAMLKSPLLQTDREYCLTFFYYSVPGQNFLNVKANTSEKYELVWTTGNSIYTGGKSLLLNFTCTYNYFKNVLDAWR